MENNRIEIIRNPVKSRAKLIATRFGIGEVVRHRLLPFRGVIFDVDAEFANGEEWWNAIPEESRPRRDQPFYHLLTENGEAAYVSQQNLEYDDEQDPPRHPALHQIFEGFRDGRFQLRPHIRN